MRPDYCPIGGQPCQSLCDTPCTTPPQRTWVGLTNEEIDKIYEEHHNQYGECESVNFGYERAIESALRSKND